MHREYNHRENIGMSESATNNNETKNKSIVPFVVLVIVTFFTALYMKGLNSGIPLHYDDLGYSATVGGTFVAVFTIASTVMRLIGGQITDRFSHFNVLLASLAGLFVGVALPAVIDQFAVVMVSRVIQGASFALATNVMTVAVMGTATRKHIGRRVGIKGAGTSLGTMLGALLSTLLLEDVGYQGFYWFYAAIMLVAIVAILVLKRTERAKPKSQPENAETDDASTSTPEPANVKKSNAPASAEPKTNATDATKSRKERIREFIAPYFMPHVYPYLAISFARRMPKGFCISFMLIFAKHAGIAMGAAFFVAAGATTLACRLFGGKLFDSDKTWLLWPLISTQIVGFVILAIAPSFATLIVAAICYGISVGTTSPFIKTITAKATPKEHWGVVNGEVYFFGDMGKAVGAFCGGLLIDATSKAFVPEIAIGFGVITSIFTAIALLLGHRAKKKQAEKPTQ